MSQQRAHTKVIRSGVLAALQQGPGTVKQIQERMGIASSSLDVHLKQMARNGAIKIAGKTPKRAIIYELTEAGEIAV